MNNKVTQILLWLALAGVLAAGCSREDKRAKLAKQAEADYAAGDYDRAEIEYKNLLQVDKTNGAAMRNLGLMALEQGRLVPAYVMLNDYNKLHPYDLATRVKYGMVLLATGKARDARSVAAELSAMQPTNAEALMLLVDSSVSSNDVAATRLFLSSIPASGAESAAYHIAMGTMEMRGRDPVKAAASFRAALALDANSSPAHMGLSSCAAINNDITNALAECKLAADLAPARSPYRMRYLDLLAMVGDTATLKTNLDQVLKKTPDFVPALLRSGQLALSERRYPDCERLVKNVLRRDATSLEGLLMMGRLRMAQNDPEQAIVELNHTAQIFPAAPVYLQLAVAHLMQNDLSGAIKSLNQALNLQPDYFEGTLLLAELQIRRGDTAQAINLLVPVLKRRPNLVQAQLLLATAFRAANKLDEALSIYDYMSRNSPTNPQPALLMGSVQRQQKNLAGARQSFERALTCAPGFLPAVEQLVNLDIETNKFTEALSRVQLELDRNPTNTLPYLLLAKIHLAASNAPAAEADLLKALAISVTAPGANALLAKVYVAENKQDSAMKKLEEMVAKNTNDIASWLMIAELHSAASNYVGAARAYETVLTINPRSPPALNNLAWLCTQQLKDLKRAFELASRARELAPSSAATADTLGWVLYQNGDYARALALLQEAARSLSENAEVQFHVGMTHYMMGEEAAARAALANAIQLGDKDAEWKPTANAALQTLDTDPAHADAAAIRELETRAVATPQDAMIQYRLAAVAENKGEWDAAANKYETALKANTNLVPVMIRLAQLYSVHPKNLERAMTLARRARSLDPGDAKIAYVLGQLGFTAAQSGSEFQWAASLLQESERGLAEDANVEFDLALALYAVGEPNNAVSRMQKAVTLKLPPGRTVQADLFLEMNRLVGSPEELMKAENRVAEVLRQQAEYVPALHASGLIKMQHADYAGARDAFEKVLKIYPAFTPVNRYLALVYANQLKDPKKAYEFASKARDANPNDREITRVLGMLVYQSGDFPRAIQLLRDCAAEYSKDADLFYALGNAHYRIKQGRECKEALTKALALAPEAPAAAEAKRILQELK